MVATKKACVIYTPEKAAEAAKVAARLGDDGFAVCREEVTSEEAITAKASNTSSLPAQVLQCLEGAEVCVILLEEDVGTDAGMGGISGIASDGGCRVVTVGGSPEALPTELDDIIDGHVPSADSPDLIDIVNGRPDRIQPDDTSAPKRDEDRVKCQ